MDSDSSLDSTHAVQSGDENEASSSPQKSPVADGKVVQEDEDSIDSDSSDGEVSSRNADSPTADIESPAAEPQSPSDQPASPLLDPKSPSSEPDSRIDDRDSPVGDRDSISSSSSQSSPAHSPSALSPSARSPSAHSQSAHSPEANSPVGQEDDEESRHSSESKKDDGEISGAEAFKAHSKGDLSDVSDLEESQDGLGFEEERPKPKVEVKVEQQDALLMRGETELDFEAEEKEEVSEEREEGECGGVEERSDGEVKDGDDLEEGELTDGDDARPEETEPRPVCRFYNRGQCTWGSNCRFVHPGVTDKGNYTMFDMVRPLVPANGPPGFPDFRFEKPPVGSFSGYPPPAKEDVPPYESAWERGLRHAKEMMRKATKRKETDMDFEEKKMNLGLGQEELDKENDYYTRPASPVRMDEPERWGRYEGDMEEEYYRPPPPDYWRRVHYQGDSRALRVETGSFGERSGVPSRPTEKYRSMPEYHEKRNPREVMPSHEGKAWREDRPERYSEVPPHKGRADEWSDPWMRSKSPSRKGGGQRRQSYSSGSSYTSSSSSRSSSRSSFSSYSSRSRSRSPTAVAVPGRRRRGSLAHREPPPPEPAVARVAPQRSTQANPAIPRKVGRPPPPQPKAVPVERKPPVTQPVAPRRKEPSPPPTKRQTPPLPQEEKRRTPPKEIAVPKAKPGRSKASYKPAANSRARSSESGSESGSSSDSSSYTSSSDSSRGPSPPPRPAKRIVIDGREAMANMLKIKALDALKVSGQKQQIKLTLKDPDANLAPGSKKSLFELGVASLSSRKEQLLPTLSRKRPAESPKKIPVSPEEPTGAKAATNKKAPSRREELLKQLKAVEDAIRRKRLRIN